jgi:hypothetical protein
MTQSGHLEEAVVEVGYLLVLREAGLRSQLSGMAVLH